MSAISKIVLVVLVYALYLLHNSKCNSLLRSMEDNPNSGMGEFVRHIRTMEAAGEDKQQLCGSRFPEMVRMVCGSSFYSPQEKRSSNHCNHRFERFRRETSLRKECCELGCTVKTLKKLCQSSTTTTPAPPTNPTNTVVPFKILRALLEFFAKTRSLSPNGYESIFPQTARSPEISSSPENAVEERNIIPEVAAQTDERPIQYQRQRLPIPKSNIIRDEDDEGSVFSVGL